MSVNEETLKSPIISGVLCYTSTARHSVRHDDIVRICLAFFKEDDIIKGKDILCNIIGDKPKRRRGEDRIMNEVRDILDMLKRCDESKFELPKFVVDSYDGLPPSSGFDLIAQSLTALNDEILNLKKEIEFLKDSRIEQGITVDDMSMIKEDLITIKGELRKMNHRGLNDDIRRSSLVLENLQNIRSNADYIDKDISGNISGTEDDVSDTVSRFKPTTSSGSNMVPSAPEMDSDNLLEILNRSFQDEGGPATAPTYSQITEKNGRQSKTISNRRSSLMNISEVHSKTTASNSMDVLKNVQEKQVKEKLPAVDEDGFTLVRNKKKTRDNIVGSKRYSGNRVMKSARKVGDLYLGNLDLDVTEDEIVEYIKDETNISVDACILLNSRNPNCKSFKISVSFESRMKLLSHEVWPEGVICRKFYNPRNK